MSGATPYTILAVLSLLAAGPALKADEHTEMIIHNITDAEHTLRSTPPAGAGSLTIRTTLPDGTTATQERNADGQVEVIAIPARATVFIDRTDPCATTWRKFKCRRGGDQPSEVSPIWYRVAGDGNRSVHAYDTWWGLEKTGENATGVFT